MNLAVSRMKFLDNDEIELIHSQSIRCLEEIGIRVGSPKAQKMMADAGADVDPKTGVTKIPESLVSESIDAAPKGFTLHARDPKHNLTIPVSGTPYVGTTGLGIHMNDIDTGKIRPATRGDVADLARLADAIDEVDFLWSMVIPRDVPSNAHTAYELWLSLTNSTKHLHQVECRNAEDAKMQIRLASLLVGGEEELRKRPLFSVVVSPDSPLVLRKEAIEGQIELARAGIPIISMTMPLAGLTSPVTIAGTLTVVNAENLASIVVTQLAARGAMHVYSSDAVPGDMTTGDVAFAAPESPLIHIALNQMAKRYSLPSMVGDWGTGDGTPGIHTSFSETSATALDSLGGPDLICGIGSTDGAKGVALEQIVLDANMWGNWKGFLRNFSITEETAALDVIRAVGHGNTFLTHPHTVRNFKKELFFRDKKVSSWEATLSDRMLSEPREIAKRLLREHEPAPVEESILREGERLIKEYEKRVGDRNLRER